jgi:hypothetical protein
VKSYSLAAFVSVIVGWAVATIFYGSYSLLAFGSFKGGDTKVIGFWSLLFSIVANLLTIQVPRSYVKRISFAVGNLQFALISSAYGLLAFTLLIG